MWLPTIMTSEHAWSVLSNGTQHCLSRIIVEVDEIDVYCVNLPSGRYMTLYGSNLLQVEVLNTVLTGSMSIWVCSNKGNILYVTLKCILRYEVQRLGGEGIYSRNRYFLAKEGHGT